MTDCVKSAVECVAVATAVALLPLLLDDTDFIDQDFPGADAEWEQETQVALVPS